MYILAPIVGAIVAALTLPRDHGDVRDPRPDRETRRIRGTAARRHRLRSRLPVRLLGRLVLVLILDALALLGLSELLPGFTLDGFVAAFGLAVLLGLANALVWPLLLRIALPFTVATLGLGALVLNGALLLLGGGRARRRPRQRPVLARSW